MKSVTKRMIALAGVLALGLVAARAQSDGALLDALVKKGVLSDQEAEDIRADETKDFAKTSASKIALGDYVKKLQFYGDGRLRFETLSEDPANHASGNVINDRERYRLRFGLIYSYSDNLTAGFELRSGTAGDTGNQSFGGSYADASINVSKIYIQYKPIDELTLIAGKFTNPLYETTDISWANDLTPEGGAETFSYTFPLGGGGSAPVRDPKDTKSIAPASAPSDSSLTIGFVAAQFFYVNQNESTAIAANPGFTSNDSDVLTIANQIPITWKINDDVTAKVVPGFTFYTGGGNLNYQSDVATGVGGTTTTAALPSTPAGSFGTANSSSDPVFYSPNAFDDLNIVSAPGEIDYKLFGQKLRTYWDFNWNVTAQQRIQNVYLGSGGVYAAGTSTPGGTGGFGFAPGGAAPTTANQAAIRNQNQNLTDGVAWAVGEQIGDNKKKGDWSILGEFRQVGLGAVDPNTNGTDWANSYANQQGVKIQGVYNFTDFLTLGVTYYNTWNYKNNLYNDLNGGLAGTPKSGTTQYMVSEASSQRVQVDLGWKF